MLRLLNYEYKKSKNFIYTSLGLFLIGKAVRVFIILRLDHLWIGHVYYGEKLDFFFYSPIVFIIFYLGIFFSNNIDDDRYLKYDGDEILLSRISIVAIWLFLVFIFIYFFERQLIKSNTSFQLIFDLLFVFFNYIYINFIVSFGRKYFVNSKVKWFWYLFLFLGIIIVLLLSLFLLNKLFYFLFSQILEKLQIFYLSILILLIFYGVLLFKWTIDILDMELFERRKLY